MIESFQSPPTVDFNPSNEEHLAAVVWMFFYGRQHPTLRFKIDPSKNTTVRETMLNEVLKYWIPDHIQNRVASENRALEAKTSRTGRKLVCYDNRDGAVERSTYSVIKLTAQ